MKILYNDSIKHEKNSTLEIKLECSYMVSGMVERGWKGGGKGVGQGLLS